MEESSCEVFYISQNLQTSSSPEHLILHSPEVSWVIKNTSVSWCDQNNKSFLCSLCHTCDDLPLSLSLPLFPLSLWSQIIIYKLVFSNSHEYFLSFLTYSIKKVDFNLETKTHFSDTLTAEFKDDYSLKNCNMATNKSTYVNYKSNTDNSL